MTMMTMIKSGVASIATVLACVAVIAKKPGYRHQHG
jgi:hypothetical protein